MPYNYLIESIKEFYNQEDLQKKLKIKALLIQNIEILLMVLLQYTLAGK